MADGDLTFGVAIKSTGDGSVTADAKAATTELENMKKATDDLAAASAKQASQSRASENDIMRYYTGLSVAEDNAKAKAWALANGYQEVGGVMVKAAEEAEAGMNKTAFATHRAYTEMVVLAREASRGNFSRMAGSATILAQGLSPLALGIAGVTAALALGAYAWEKMTNDVDAETEAAKESEKQFDAVSLKLREQNVLLQQRVTLAAQGITSTTPEETKQIFEQEQIIARMKGDIADGVKIGRDGFYLTEDLAREQQKLNGLLEQNNDNQKLNNQLKQDGHGKNLHADQEKALDKTYADAQRLDAQMVESHQSAFDKTIDAWIAMKQKMEAQGIYYGKMREEHEAAYTVFVNAENLKRNAAAAAAAKKKSDAEAQHQASAINSEKNFFARIQAMADAADQFSGSKKNLQYNKELIALNAQHKKTADAVKNDHAASLAEQERYLIAVGNLKQAYAIQTFTVDTSITAMISAFNANNRVAEIESTLGYFQQLSSLGASHHRAMFEINKRASEASAIVNTYEAATAALKLGPFLGPAMAAAITAMGIAKVDAIESTQFGGGAASSGGGGVPSMSTSPGLPVSGPSLSTNSSYATPASHVPAPTQTINLTIAGALNNPAVAQNYDWFVNTVLPLAKNAKDNGHLVDFNVMMT